MPLPISRRDALRSFAGAAALATLTRPTLGAEEKNPSPATTALTPIRHSVCKWCYSKIPLDDFAKAAKDIGLESVELLDPKDWPTVQKYGLTCALANGTMSIPSGFNRLENHAKYVPSMIERINACADAGIPSVIVFSGNRNDKTLGKISDEQGLENCAIGLKQIVGVAEKRGVNIIMELLNSKVNHKDYMCDHTAWGVELVKRVGSERFKLLYDIYHMQIMEGDVIATIRKQNAYFAHYHTGGVPGRHEIDETQELNYPAILKAIADTGYKGFVAQEFIPARPDALGSLRQAVRLCDV
jgi:hydroxypyruvate isomerase